MRTRLTPNITGTVAAADLVRAIKRILEEELQFYDSPTVKFLLTTRGITAYVKLPPASSLSGWHWATPIELPAAPYPAYDAGSIIHIQSTNAIVTAGIVDAGNPSGPLVQSLAGFWVSTQAVPAQTTVTGVDVYDLPQMPLPNPNNLDDPKNFWAPYWPDSSCF